MKVLELYSEPFSKTGNMAAEGFRRLLGRPTLGLLQTLLRESIQNVLDAAKRHVGPRILIRLRYLDGEERGVLADRALGELPAEDATRSDIESSLAGKRVRVLEICDFGTVGLSGPTRADAPHDGEEALNFVNFLRNVGAGRDTRQGGGTYGYGKSSLYAMSRCSTIVVDSLTSNAGLPVRRLMGCHLGAAFDAHEPSGHRRRFTGRHWWGIRAAFDSIEPAVGDEAEELSRALGMPVRESGDTGTTILILDPQLGDLDGAEVGQEIVEIVLWNFWPRMTRSTPKKRRISVGIEIDGQPVEVPLPEEFPPLDLFSSAMSALRRGDNGVQPITSAKPKKHLGSLAMETGMRAERYFSAGREESVIPQQSSHIALMRPVELVVTYIQGEPLPDQRFEWAGVFVCSDDNEVESAFADAEPPAHDDWIPDNLPKGQAKTMVNVAMRKLREAAQTHANPSSPADTGDDGGPSLAGPACQLGRLLEQTSARGPGRSSPGVRPVAVAKGLAISAGRFSGLEVDGDGRPVAVFRATLRNDGSNPQLMVVATPHLVADGGAVSEEYLPAQFVVQVLEMEFGEGRLRAEGPRLPVGVASGDVVVRVAMPAAAAAVGVKLKLESDTA